MERVSIAVSQPNNERCLTAALSSVSWKQGKH
jgi:hypothetical protein